MATSDVEALIQGRASAQQHAYTTANVDKLMTFYTKDVDFTDVAMGAFNLNYDALRGFYEAMYNQVHDMTITNTSVSGTTPELVTWEMDLGFTLTTDSAELGLKTGEKVLAKGVQVQHWGEVTDNGSGEKAWKIWKESDYFIVVKKE